MDIFSERTFDPVMIELLIFFDEGLSRLGINTEGLAQPFLMNILHTILTCLSALLTSLSAPSLPRGPSSAAVSRLSISPRRCHSILSCLFSASRICTCEPSAYSAGPPPPPTTPRRLEREDRCEPLPTERNEIALRILATNCEAGEDNLPTMAEREGRLTARRLRPPSRLDQKTVCVSRTEVFAILELVRSEWWSWMFGICGRDLRCPSAVALGPSEIQC